MLPPLLEALRPRQWTKNLILFAPLLFARKMTDPAALGRTLLAFAIFCLLSGAVYLINDLQDLARDRLHPVKSRRPLASGRLGRGHALAALAVILVLGLGGAYLLTPELVTRAEAGPLAFGGPSRIVSHPSFLSCALLYVALLSAYSLRLKQVVILDVMIIALGFVVRAVAGATVIAVQISHWLLICTIFLALFLALSKRRHELVLLSHEASSHRATLADYDEGLLDQMIVIVVSACVISYALYTMAPETVTKFGTDRLNITIPFVIYGLFRYLYLVHRRSDGGDPASSLLSDRPLLVAVLLWAAVGIAVIY